MQFSTTRFGAIEVEDHDIVTFAEGLPGFETARNFVFLSQNGSDGVLRWMQCVDGESSSALAFPVVSPWRVDEQYMPTIPGSVLRELAIEDVRAQAQFWAIVTVPRDRPQDSTVNLLAPVIVNRATGAARQVVLVSDERALRTPLASSPSGDPIARPAGSPELSGCVAGREAVAAAA